jgi:hypothetical protein
VRSVTVGVLTLIRVFATLEELMDPSSNAMQQNARSPWHGIGPALGSTTLPNRNIADP